MTKPFMPALCVGGCGSKGAASSCDCAPMAPSPRARAARYGAGFIAICALCCAVPPALVGLGLIGATAGVYLGVGAKAAMIGLALVGVGYLALRVLKTGR